MVLLDFFDSLTKHGNFFKPESEEISIQGFLQRNAAERDGCRKLDPCTRIWPLEYSSKHPVTRGHCQERHFPTQKAKQSFASVIYIYHRLEIHMEVGVCVCVYTHLGCPVPETVHCHSCSIVCVSHVDDRLSDRLNHFLLTSEQTQIKEKTRVSTSCIHIMSYLSSDKLNQMYFYGTL